jgi:hypothetical protein
MRLDEITIAKYYDGPRYWYHALFARHLNAQGGIDPYPLPRSEQELSRLFRDWKDGDGVVYLSQQPINSDALKIDITKLDLDNKFRFTGQVEGHAVYHGTIPAEAIERKDNG